MLDDPMLEEEEEATPAGWTRCPRIAASRAECRATNRQHMECIEISDSDDE
jgi:hypothetical protein